MERSLLLPSPIVGRAGQQLIPVLEDCPRLQFWSSHSPSLERVSPVGHTETPTPPFAWLPGLRISLPGPTETSLRLISQPLNHSASRRPKKRWRPSPSMSWSPGSPTRGIQSSVAPGKDVLGGPLDRVSWEVLWRPETNQKLSIAWALGRGLESLPPHSGCASSLLGATPDGKVVTVQIQAVLLFWRDQTVFKGLRPC